MAELLYAFDLAFDQVVLWKRSSKRDRDLFGPDAEKDVLVERAERFDIGSPGRQAMFAVDRDEDGRVCFAGTQTSCCEDIVTTDHPRDSRSCRPFVDILWAADLGDPTIGEHGGPIAEW